jgi:KaiC/GvpD/RAD55 family RecA-like ATPase
MSYEITASRFMTTTTNKKLLSMSELREKMVMTAERVQKIESAELIYEKLIAKGLITVIAAPPNGGKTTIVMHIAKVLANSGLQVIYIDYDSAGIHVREYFQYAKNSNFDYWAEMDSDIDALQLVDNLVAASKKEENQSECIYIFDTLKKFTNLMNKNKVAEFMSKIRILTRHGSTVILLAHTNKRPESDGNYLFEGVGDVKNDCDNLFYLIPMKNHDGSTTVTVDFENNGKKKALLEPCTFVIQPDRTVNLANKYAQPTDLKNYELDKEYIEMILSFLSNGELNESTLVDLCQQQGISRRNSRRILRSHQSWNVRKGDKNATLYSALE